MDVISADLTLTLTLTLTQVLLSLWTQYLLTYSLAHLLTTQVLLSLMDVLSAFVDVGINPQLLRAFRLLRVLKLLRSWR